MTWLEKHEGKFIYRPRYKNDCSFTVLLGDRTSGYLSLGNARLNVPNKLVGKRVIVSLEVIDDDS